MSSDTTIYAHVHSALDAVPNRAGNLSDVTVRGRSRQRRNRIGYGVVAVAAVFLIAVPVALTIGNQTQEFGAGLDSEGEVVFDSGFTVGVVGDPVESLGALVFQGAPVAPTTASFDPATLGIEYAFSERGAVNLIVPPSDQPFEDNALQADLLVYLGDIGGAQIALGQTCVFFGNGTEITGGGFCDITDQPTVGYSADPVFPDSDGGWLVWTMLPVDTAVVQITLEDDTMYWQRPIARTALFAVADPDQLVAATTTAYDSTGAVISTAKPSFLDGHENWKDPLGDRQ